MAEHMGGEPSTIKPESGCSQCGVQHERGSDDCPLSRIGRTIAGRFHIDSLIGLGGMGAVYRARHLELEVDVALKMMHLQFARNPSLVQRFLREARAAAALKHPGIVAVTDLGRAEDGSPFLVMELLVGESLQDEIDRGAPTIARAVSILIDVLDGLGMAHENGVIHRDLKPENLFLVQPREDGSGGGVKILDFGIAKIVATEQLTLTSGAGVLGTPVYMSPEQIDDVGRVDARADLYSIGAILFYVLTGRWVVEGQSVSEVLIRAAGGLVRRHPRELEPRVPEWLDAVVAKALAADVGERYGSAREMGAALRAGREQERRGGGHASGWDGATGGASRWDGGVVGAVDEREGEAREERSIESMPTAALSDVETSQILASVWTAARGEGWSEGAPGSGDREGGREGGREAGGREAAGRRANGGRRGTVALAREGAAALSGALPVSAEGEVPRSARRATRAGLERASGEAGREGEAEKGKLEVDSGLDLFSDLPSARSSGRGWLVGALALLVLGMLLWPRLRPAGGGGAGSTGPGEAAEAGGAEGAGVGGEAGAPGVKGGADAGEGGATEAGRGGLAGGGPGGSAAKQGFLREPIVTPAARLKAPDGMALVPGGTLVMGLTSGGVGQALSQCGAGEAGCGARALEREQPARTVTVSPFYMDVTEVTNAQFAVWLAGREGLEQGGRDGIYEDGALLLRLDPENGGLVYRPGRFSVRAGYEQRPLVEVTWRGALRYCQAQGKILPTEAQWEAAARGPDGRLFPWGSQAPECTGVAFGKGVGSCGEGSSPSAVRTSPQDRTPQGIFDLGGNVSELVLDGYRAPYPACQAPCRDPRVEVGSGWGGGPGSASGNASGNASADAPGEVPGNTVGSGNPAGSAHGAPIVIRGGRWNAGAFAARGTARDRLSLEEPRADVGFRCVVPAGG